MSSSAGFDTGSYPGDEAMQAWAANSPYDFVGFYLSAPCHSNKFAPFSGKYKFITALGFGLAVIYVGHQQDGCGSHDVSRLTGLAHGADTVAKCAAEGFPPGTIVFLDVEAFEGPLSSKMADYIRGWISALLDSAAAVGPGIYCTHRSANEILLAAQQEYSAHNLASGAPAFWIVKTGDSEFDPLRSAPTQCGVSFANVWQGRLDVKGEQHGGVALDIDQNVADTRDPSGTLVGVVTT